MCLSIFNVLNLLKSKDFLSCLCLFLCFRWTLQVCLRSTFLFIWRELVWWLQVIGCWSQRGGALPRSRPSLCVVVGCFGASGAGTTLSKGKEGAGLWGNNDARDSTDRASHHVSLCVIPALSDRQIQLSSFLINNYFTSNLVRLGKCFWKFLYQ